MEELLEKVDIYDLLDLVREYSESYKMSSAFQLSLKYLIDNHPQESYSKSVLLTELVDVLGEKLALREIESLLND